MHANFPSLIGGWKINAITGDIRCSYIWPLVFVRDRSVHTYGPWSLSEADLFLHMAPGLCQRQICSYIWPLVFVRGRSVLTYGPWSLSEVDLCHESSRVCPGWGGTIACDDRVLLSLWQELQKCQLVC